MGFIILLAILILTFLLRALPGIFGLTTLQHGDEIYHLLCAERIRENKFRYPEKLRGFLLPGIYDYPPLLHYFLALFPRTRREQIAPFISPLIDTVQVVVIYFFTLYLFKLLQFAQYAINPSWVAGVAALLFATSPALLYYGIGPRSYHATPRALSELFITLTFLFVLIYYCNTNLPVLFLASFFAALTLLTSKFGGQVIIFFSIGLAAFLRAPVFLLLPILGFFFALLLSKGHYWKVLIGWIKHSIHLKRTIDKSKLLIERNNPTIFKNMFSSGVKGDFVGFATNLYSIINNNTYVILVIRNAMLFVLLFLGVRHWQLITSNNATIFLASWVAISLVVFSITSLKPFLFLGEAERYIECSIPAQVILFSFLCIPLTSHAILITLLLYHAIFYAGNFVTIYTAHKAVLLHRGNDEEELFDWFKREEITGRKIISIPQTCSLIVYKTDNAVLCPPANFTQISVKQVKSLWEEMGWPNRDIQRLVEDYDIDIILVYKKKLKYALKKGWNYDLSPYIKIFENRIYAVYRTTPRFHSPNENIISGGLEMKEGQNEHK